MKPLSLEKYGAVEHFHLHLLKHNISDVQNKTNNGAEVDLLPVLYIHKLKKNVCFSLHLLHFVVLSVPNSSVVHINLYICLK